MVKLKINGYDWLYNVIAMTLHDINNPANYSTLNHLTPNERQQIFNHLKYNTL